MAPQGCAWRKRNKYRWRITTIPGVHGRVVPPGMVFTTPLRTSSAFVDVVPTRHYGANCAWQQLSILAYNVARSFQLDTIATPRRRSRKRTYAYVLRSMRTLRFLLVARAGRLTRIGGRQVLRLAQNPATEALYARIHHALAA